MNIKAYIKNPFRILLSMVYMGWFDKLCDETYLKLLYLGRLGYIPDIKNPKTFCEKLLWLKLYDRKPEYTVMVDKLAVKSYVASIIGEQYIIPKLGDWDSPEEINFDMLPDSFVLKTTHDSGNIIICKNKNEIDKAAVLKKLNDALNCDYYLMHREWPYKNVVRRIVAESYMEDLEGELLDYKFFCFNGKPTYCQVISNRFTEECIDFFDMDWKHQDFNGLSDPGLSYPCREQTIPTPKTFEKMKDFAAKLSNGIPFLRVDFYEVNGALYFGELTFYPMGGFGTFSSPEWDEKFGELLDLTVINKKLQDAEFEF